MSACNGSFRCFAKQHIEGCFTGDGHPDAMTNGTKMRYTTASPRDYLTGTAYGAVSMVLLGHGDIRLAIILVASAVAGTFIPAYIRGRYDIKRRT